MYLSNTLTTVTRGNLTYGDGVQTSGAKDGPVEST